MHQTVNTETPDSIAALGDAVSEAFTENIEPYVDQVLTRALDTYGEYYDTKEW